MLLNRTPRFGQYVVGDFEQDEDALYPSIVVRLNVWNFRTHVGRFTAFTFVTG